MSETQFPPPRPSGTSVNTSSGTTDRYTIRDALVLQAPATLSQPDKTLLLDGKVTGNDIKRGEIHITTAKGPLVIQSPTPLPKDAEVSIELKMQNLSLRAQVTVLRQKATEAQDLRNMAPPQTGATPQTPVKITPQMTVTALRLPPDTPTTPPAATQTTPASNPPQDLSLSQAAAIIEAARKVGIAQLPGALPALPPIPMPVLWQVLNTRNVESALLRLPPVMQQQITSFLQQPDVISALQKIIPPAQLATMYPPPATAQPSAPADQADDMLTAQIATRPATTATPADIQAAQTAALRGILPLLEGLLPGVSSALSPASLPPIAKTFAAAPLPQNMVQVKIDGILPAADAPVPAGNVRATVESITPAGFPILKLPDGHIVLQQALDVETGATLSISLTPMSAADILAMAPTLAAGLAPPSFDPFSTRAWPALQEALQVLLNPTVAAAQTALRNTIPSPANARMAPTTLFFLAALRMGNIESWLGDNILQALRQSGRKDLADRLGGDFSRLSIQSKTALAGDWRVISLPLLHDEQLSQIQFYVRHQHERDESDAEDDGAPKKMTRFILNLTLSRMGDLQLDGLMHKKRLDLVLRSSEKLPADIRQEIAKRYTAGIEEVSLQGSITFQTRKEGWTVIEANTPGSRLI
jgi:hypothetical protein